MRFLKGAVALAIIFCLVLSFPLVSLAYQTLRPDTQGTEVLSMQKALNSLGFPLSADGKYGPNTLAVVTLFQQKNKLKQDGIAGNQTLSLLYRLTNAADQGTAPNQDESTIVYPDSEGTVTTRGRYELGSFGKEVANLQSALSNLGFTPGRFDGVYDVGTRAAVISFQQKNGLAADGIAGTQTLAILYSGNAAPGNSSQPTQPPAILVPETRPDINTRLEMGSQGPAVVSLQAKLLGLGYTPGRTDGIFDAGTKAALISFQGRNGLSRDGIAGPRTLSKLYSVSSPSDGEGAQEGSGSQVMTNAVVQTGNSGSLRFRSSPSVSDSLNIIGGLANGQIVIILSQSGIWSHIRWGILEGYVMTGFLKLSGGVDPVLPSEDENMQPLPDSAVSGVGVVKTSNGGAVRLRSSATISQNNVLQSIPNGSELLVLSQLGSWLQVRFGRNTGYMMREFIQFTAAPVNPQPSEEPPESEQDPGSEEETGFKRILRSGDSGEDVHRLQMRLSELLYAVTVNSLYDSTTVAAVRNFQRLNGLKVDGVFGSSSASAIQSPEVRNASSNPLSYSSIRMGDKDGADQMVSKLQARLAELGYKLSVDGTYGSKTHDAIVAFQHQNNMSISGIADALTQSSIYASDAKHNTGSTPGIDISQGQIGGPSSASVKLLHWYTEVKPVLGGASVLVYHPASGVSFNLKMYSLGRHADAEPKTLKDTQLMNAAFGAASWNTRIVYVKLPTGVWTLGSMHNYPHLSGSISDNGFGGHLCLHFLRDLDETQKLDPNYGMQNQRALRSAWKGMTGEEVN